MYANIIGWIPAIILPAAALSQLYKIIKNGHGSGVSKTTWLLFGLANLATYFFTEKYFLIQSILAFLLTSILDFAIILVIYVLDKRSDD